MTDVPGPLQRIGLAQEPFHTGPVGQLDGADGQGRRDAGHKIAKRLLLHRPDLDLYAGSPETGGAHKARLGGNRVREGEQSVRGGGPQRPAQMRAAGCQLAVERLSEQMGPHDRQLDLRLR